MARWFILALALLATTARAQEPSGLVTLPSAHPVRETLDRFAAALRAAGWTVFTEIDHAAAAQAVGMSLRARTVLFFGSPRAGTPAMQAHPTLALDLPMRILVWEDEAGRSFLTRSTGEDIARRVFARHGVTVPPEAQRATEETLAGFTRQAVE